MSTTSVEQQIDPTTFSVFSGRLDSIVREMTGTLENAAFTAILALTRDYSCCIYDARERQVAMVDAIPIHTNSMNLVLQAMREMFGDDINEGDVIVCNDPYHGNTHNADLVTAHPVFWEGKQVFWTVVRGNQLDCGAAVPHSANAGALNVYQEGLTIPPLKLYDRGVLRQDVLELYLSNVRWRDQLRGDLMAQLGSIWTGGRRLREMCGAFGRDVIEQYTEALLDYAYRRTVAEIRTMPNGVYESEGWMDTDGSDKTDVLIKCSVTISDESIHVDFAGSAPSGPHGLNESYGCLQAAGSIPVMMAIDPGTPHNDGCMRCVTVSAPLGSVCNAQHPSSTAQSTTVPSDLMQDIVCKALAKAIPDRIRAGGPHWSTAPMVSGVDERTGVFFGHLAMNGGGGGPAANGADGWPLITCLAGFGGLKAAPIEYSELLNPFSIDFCEVETDSMGLGEYIGGPGIRWALRPLYGPMEVMSCGDGITNPPYGVGGGTPGDGGGSYIESCSEPAAPRRFMHSQLVPMEVDEGERWVGVSPGGGGWGDPLKRPVARVVEDVRDGLYSASAAQEIYGLVLRDAASCELDEPATEALRAELRGTRHVDPTSTNPTQPRTCDWFERSMRDGDIFIAPMAWEGSKPIAHSTNDWPRPVEARRGVKPVVRLR